MSCLLSLSLFFIVVILLSLLLVAFCCFCRQSLLVDRRSEPRQGERVPYVVVYSTPGLPLIQLVRKPLDLLAPESGLRLNASYYITKQLLPPLDRAFSLLGVDVREW